MRTYPFCPFCKTSLERATIDGRERQFCPACSWIHYVNPLPVMVACTVNRNNELLVIRRGHEPAYNEWALPGGFLEIGEEPAAGCLRELLEETGLSGRIERVIGIFERQVELYGSLLVVAYRVRVDDDRLAINHEVLEAGFFGHDRLPEVRIPLHRQIIEAGYLSLLP